MCEQAARRTDKRDSHKIKQIFEYKRRQVRVGMQEDKRERATSEDKQEIATTYVCDEEDGQQHARCMNKQQP
jgi:hypothetical protein